MANKIALLEHLNSLATAVKAALNKKIDKDEFEVGGRNLLLGSATKKISPYGGAQISFENNVSVSEWGATDAIRAYGTSGTNAAIAVINGTVYTRTILGRQYTHSIYIKNNSTKTIRVTNNIAEGQDIQPGEITRLVIHGIGSGNNVQFTFRTPTAGDAFDFTYWRPKIEEGSVVTAWTPAPEDKAESSHTHNYAGASSSGGAATSAAKLSAARTIGLSGDAIASTPASFDGSANTNIAVSSLRESYIETGGVNQRNYSGEFGSLDAAMISDLGANRFAFALPAGITVEYSKDGGSTWAAYPNVSDAAKTALTSTGTSFIVGNATTSNLPTSKDKLRITFETSKCSVYTVINKFALYVSTNGSGGCTVSIQKSLQSTPDTWVSVVDNVPISGWSGWNIINSFTPFTTYGNSASVQYGKIRFTFSIASHSNSKYAGLTVQKIYAFGGMGWSTPSNMAKTGHLYNYDYSQTMYIPKHLYSSLNGYNNPILKVMNVVNHGADLLIGSNGLTIVGAGESPDTFYGGAGLPVGSETLYLTSDEAVKIVTNLQNGYSNGKTVTIDESAGITAPGGFKGNADTATKLTSSAGSATQPVYFSDGKPVATTYTLGASVPSGAKFTDTTYAAATTSASGLMSSTDKTKLDGITAGANKYTHPTTAGNKHIPSGGSSGQILRWSADGTAVWGADNNTTYGVATSSANGLMSATDKSKLDNDVLVKTNAVTASIPTTGWNSDSTTTYTKYYDITVSGVSEKDRADIIISPSSISVAETCGFCPTNETLAGKIRVRAQSIPTAAISVQYWIEKGK